MLILVMTKYLYLIGLRLEKQIYEAIQKHGTQHMVLLSKEFLRF